MYKCRRDNAGGMCYCVRVQICVACITCYVCVVNLNVAGGSDMLTHGCGNSCDPVSIYIFPNCKVLLIKGGGSRLTCCVRC